MSSDRYMALYADLVRKQRDWAMLPFTAEQEEVIRRAWEQHRGEIVAVPKRRPLYETALAGVLILLAFVSGVLIGLRGADRDAPCPKIDP